MKIVILLYSFAESWLLLQVPTSAVSGSLYISPTVLLSSQSPLKNPHPHRLLSSVVCAE